MTPVSDLTLSLLLMARRRERSHLRGLLFARDHLLASGLEQVVEAAIGRVAVRSRHEQVTREQRELPASRRTRVRFYDRPETTPPADGDFGSHPTQRFPLAGTVSELTCPGCTSGKIDCGRCRGTGGISRGSSPQTCPRCHGSGKASHRRCAGEGRLARFEVSVHRWPVRTEAAIRHPVDRPQPRVRLAFERLRRRENLRVDDLSLDTVLEHLGLEHLGDVSPAAERVRQGMLADQGGLEAAARGHHDRYLFHRTTLELAPAGYVVRRRRGRPCWYWRIGAGAEALEVGPAQWPCPWRVGGWLATATTLLATAEWAARRTLLPAPAQPWSALAEVSDPALVAGGLCAAAVALALAWAATRPQPSVRTVVLLREGSTPTAYLPCLAATGSFSGALTVADRTYGHLTRTLLGGAPDPRQSASLSLRLTSGETVHILELARPEDLSSDQARHLATAVDGLIFVVQSPRANTQLRNLVEQAMSDRYPVPTTTVLIGRSALHLERLRADYVNSVADPAAAFRALWQPVRTVLDLPAPQRSIS